MKTQDLNKNLTLLEKVNLALADLNKEITTGDRSAAKEEKNWSAGHLSNYMNGRGSDLDTAIELLVFFRARVDARKKIIEANL